MENMMAQPPDDGAPAMTSIEVVSKVLSQSSSSSPTFLKNASLPKHRPTTPRSNSEDSLRQELAAEKQSSAVLLDTIEDLKKRSEAADERLATTQSCTRSSRRNRKRASCSS